MPCEGVRLVCRKWQWWGFLYGLSRGWVCGCIKIMTKWAGSKADTVKVTSYGFDLCATCIVHFTETTANEQSRPSLERCYWNKRIILGPEKIISWSNFTLHWQQLRANSACYFNQVILSTVSESFSQLLSVCVRACLENTVVRVWLSWLSRQCSWRFTGGNYSWSSLSLNSLDKADKCHRRPTASFSPRKG